MIHTKVDTTTVPMIKLSQITIRYGRCLRFIKARSRKITQLLWGIAVTLLVLGNIGCAPPLAIGFKTINGPGPTGRCGKSIWTVHFLATSRSGATIQPDAASAGGFILQKVNVQYNIINCATGQPADPNRNPLVYYEAFLIRNDGMSGPNNNTDSYDKWEIGQRNGTRGSIKTVGEAMFHQIFQQGEMAAGAVPNAAAAKSSYNRPANVGSPTLTREMTVMWNCCPGSPGHNSMDIKAANQWGTYKESWRWRPPPDESYKHKKEVDGRVIEEQ